MSTQNSSEEFRPLSAVATTAKTMSNNNEIGQFFEVTKEIEDAGDQSGPAKEPERSPADIAADFANEFLMHRHRGVINCDSHFVIFGNDGYATDQRSRIECSEVWGKLRQYEPENGTSSDGCTWSLVLTDHSREMFNEEELNQLVWDTWIEVCDRFETKMPSGSQK